MLVALLAIGGCRGMGVAASTEHFPEQTGFVQRSVTVDGIDRNVWVFVPPGYSQQRMYPAILFLHGLFEKGNGGADVLAAGLGPVIARNPERWPFITIFPQSDGTWSSPEHERLAMKALNGAMRHYMIDPDRVILAGLSFGGLGVWEIGARNDTRFAALVPVSAKGAMELVPLLTTVPIWAFASRGDLVVNSEDSADMCRAIQARGGRAAFTAFEGGKHDCWDLAVDQTGLVNWMLTQRRNPLVQGGGKHQNWGRLRAWDRP